MSSSNSPCAACKFLRRKCTQECVFAPYFPPDQPQKFANVHKVFGASNVAKLLNELPANHREDAVNSLAYEAEARIREPVYGCVGLISILQHRLKRIQSDLYEAKKELATYIGPPALMPMFQPTASGFVSPHNQLAMMGYNVGPMMGLSPAGAGGGAGPSHVGAGGAGPSHVGGSGGGGPSHVGGVGGGPPLVIREPQPLQQHLPQQSHHQHFNAGQHHQQQLLEQGQQLAAMAVRDEQEMLRSLEQQQQQLIARINSGFDVGSGSGTGVEFTPLNGSASMSPSLALGGSFDNPYQIQQQQQQSQEQEPLLLLQQPLPDHQNRHQQQQEPLLLLQQPSTHHFIHQQQQPHLYHNQQQEQPHIRHHHQQEQPHLRHLHQQEQSHLRRQHHQQETPHQMAEGSATVVPNPQAMPRQQVSHHQQLAHQPTHQQLAHQAALQQQAHQRSGSDEDRTAGPSS